MKKNLRKKIIFCLLASIEALFCFTPLGSIPIGFMVATLSCVPVIITSIILGPYYGGLMGFLFGLFSFMVWTFMPPNPAFAFVWTPFYNFVGLHSYLSIIVCFVPRILSGIVPSIVYRKWKGDNIKRKTFVMSIASIIGSLCNTLLVLGFIWLFFGKQYEQIYNATPGVVQTTILALIGTTILTNGIPECIVAAIVCPIVSKVLKIKGSS